MTVPGLQTCCLVMFAAVWSSHLIITTLQPQSPVLLSWLKWWVVAGLAFTLDSLNTSKVGDNQTQ